MLQDAHSRKISSLVTAPVGDTVIIPFSNSEWHYVHELLGDLSAAGTLRIIAINQSAVERILGGVDLADAQGVTFQDEPGEDNRPRFEVKPGEDVVLRVTGGTFTGSLHWSIRN